MRKKLLAGMMTVMVLGMFVTGCRKENDKNSIQKNEMESKAGKEKVDLSIWAGEEDKEYIAIVADNFIKEHASEADITIEWSPVVEGQCRSNLLGDVLNGPDVYTTTDGDIQSIVAGGAADAVRNPDEIRANNLEASVDAMTVAGEENQKLRFQMRGQGPSNINASKSDEVMQDQAIRAVIAQSEYSELQRLGGNFWDPTSEFGAMLATGKEPKDLQAEMDKMVKKVTASTVG